MSTLPSFALTSIMPSKVTYGPGMWELTNTGFVPGVAKNVDKTISSGNTPVISQSDSPGQFDIEEIGREVDQIIYEMNELLNGDTASRELWEEFGKKIAELNTYKTKLPNKLQSENLKALRIADIIHALSNIPIEDQASLGNIDFIRDKFEGNLKNMLSLYLMKDHKNITVEDWKKGIKEAAPKDLEVRFSDDIDGLGILLGDALYTIGRILDEMQVNYTKYGVRGTLDFSIVNGELTMVLENDKKVPAIGTRRSWKGISILKAYARVIHGTYDFQNSEQSYTAIGRFPINRLSAE